LYQKLTGGESVHLLDWPQVGHIDELVIQDMDNLRTFVNEGLSIRAKNQTKVRQPLASVTIPENGKVFNFDDILKEELNVKSVKTGTFALDLKITPELKREGMMREVIRQVQNTRKATGLNVDDRIVLTLNTRDDELEKAIQENQEEIAKETLATSVRVNTEKSNSKLPVIIDGVELFIDIKKAT